MTLCKYRPQRTYDAQYIIEQNDAFGLVKMLGEKAGDSDFHAGAWLAFGLMFEMAESGGIVDMWTDFIGAFDERVGRYTEEGE
ncbi:MAG: hypothetical protein IIZ12_05985 [Eggerthellaceae bacterium]|nr:hypothetical protein [Eggerthellaceae bacterium]